MLGTVFREVLEDLQRESLHELAKEIEGSLRGHATQRHPMISISMREYLSTLPYGYASNTTPAVDIGISIPLSLVLSMQKLCTTGQLLG